MLLRDPDRNDTPEAAHRPEAFPSPLVDAGKVLQRCLQKQGLATRNSLALRCDDLPQLYITEPVLEETLSLLLQAVLAERPHRLQAYLHITCRKEPRVAEGAKAARQHYSIQFHTNLLPSLVRTADTGSAIARIGAALSPFGGSLLVNQLTNTGCVFSITLPGK